MNSVILIGRLTKNPDVRRTDHAVIASFTVAVDRPRKSDAEKQSDFPRVVVFGKQAENCEKFLSKGLLVGIQGRLQTGSYQNKEGNTVYTTDVMADRVEFLEWKQDQGTPMQQRGANKESQQQRYAERPASDVFRDIDEYDAF